MKRHITGALHEVAADEQRESTNIATGQPGYWLDWPGGRVSPDWKGWPAVNRVHGNHFEKDRTMLKFSVTEPGGTKAEINGTYHTLSFAETLAELDPFQKQAKTPELRFFWNGIKVGKGKLQRVFYSGGEYLNHPAGTIAIYAREHTPFSPEIRAAFTVKNDSDGMIDYFETDSIKVHPDHPLYGKVKDALDARNAHYA